VAFTPDGQHAYVTNFDDNTVSFIDAATQTTVGTIPVGRNPEGLAVAPDGKIYVADFGDNTISVIDSSTNTVTATLPARVQPQDVTVNTTARPGILGELRCGLAILCWGFVRSIAVNPQRLFASAKSTG
jgi:YVTN family beta-propeller protein